ncbi:MAG: helix-turn-helix domain-containing protein [Firmicutes bacterium]|nr:helix-turn-helix domain-containing protein [Bacillota bacterium]
MDDLFIKGSSIGDTIYYLRIIKGISRKQLAQMLSVSERTISNYENNKTHPDITVISKLSVIFGVSMNLLLKGYEPERKSSVLDPL